MVTLKQLDTFIWVCRLQTFQSAADRLFMTQSAVSKRLQDLEAELGFQLIDRQQRSLRLTPKGEALLPLAEEVLRGVKKIEAMRGGGEYAATDFRFGATELVSLTWLSAGVDAVQHAFPHVRFHAEVGMNRAIHAALKSGALDMAVLREVGPDAPLITRRLATIPYALMSAPKLLENRRVRTLADLDDIVFIHQGPHSWSGDTMVKWMQQNGAALRRTVITNSLATTARLVLSGIGIAALPLEATASLRNAGRMLSLEVGLEVPSISCVLMYREHPMSTLHSDDIADLVQSVCDFSRSMELVI